MATYTAKSNLWNGIESFAQRQPELFIVGALAGGFLLGYFLKGASGRTENRDSHVHSARFAASTQGNANDGSSLMSSARLGATEEQITRSMQQSAATAVPRDEVSTTGTAYDFDPKSITAG